MEDNVTSLIKQYQLKVGELEVIIKQAGGLVEKMLQVRLELNQIIELLEKNGEDPGKYRGLQ